MDCSAVQELLSAYFDGELSAETRAKVTEHLARCGDCARELEEFRGLSVLAEGLIHPEPPTQIWKALEGQLSTEFRQKSERKTLPAWFDWTRRPVARLLLATAAFVLVAAGWLSYKSWLDDGDHHRFTAVFGQYLDEFRRDPQAAQQILLTNYRGQAVDAQQAVHTVGYRPSVADGLPDGYSIESTYVMKMPCCTCVQCNCIRNDGTALAIFEHDDKQAEWFGNRPETVASCGGKQCGLVQLDGQIAASWKIGERHMTVIGARDAEEVALLVTWFDDRRRNGIRSR